jgi:predicted regulator of Ras-like GTPase activity (Roadblock/LC7/MglB family)
VLIEFGRLSVTHNGINSFFLTSDRANSYVRKLLSLEFQMATLKELVRGLAERSGVEAVLVLSSEGLPIEQASRGSFDAESVAALTATLVQYAARLGSGVARGAFRTAVLEYERGLLVVAQISTGECLAIQAAPEADIGPLLYDLRQHRPALAGLL